MVVKKIVILLLSISFSGTVVFGQFTAISDAGYGSEPDLYQVLDVVAPISGGWSDTAALNSNLSGRRIDDNADQLWSTGDSRVTVLATFWGGTADPSNASGQVFRYADDPDGSGPTTLGSLNTPGDSAGFTVNNGVIGSDGGSYGSWSSESLNSGPFSDRAVTFNATGLDVYAWLAGTAANPTTSLLASSIKYPAYIVAFENGIDGDYQDMLVLIESIRPVPAPSAIALGGIGLFFVGWLKRRRTSA